MQKTLTIEEIFPYEKIREGQQELIKITAEISKNGGNAVIEGCNGLGKTIGVLTGVIPAAIRKDKTILYLARTHKQIDRVMNELKVISDKIKIKGISLRGRKEMCFNSLVNKYCPDPRSAMDVCKELQRQKRCIYFENLNNDPYLFEKTKKAVLTKPVTAKELISICKNSKICPYELSKKLLMDVRIIAMNFLYIMSPDIRKLFLSSINKKLNDLIIIFDEAHNVPGIAINISSDSLSKTSIKTAAKEADKYKLKKIKTFTKKLLDIFMDLEYLMGDKEEEILIPNYILEEKIHKKISTIDLNSFLEDMHTKGEMIQKLMISEGQFPRSYIHRVSEFLMYWLDTEGKKEYCHVMRRYKHEGGYRSNKLEIIALDPRKITEKIYREAYATISVSGTIQPLTAFRDIVGLPKDTLLKVVKSPFDKKNVLSLIVEGVSTALNQRVKKNYDKIIEKICEAVDATPGNIGVFSASYRVLKDLLDNGLEDKLSKKAYIEQPNSTSRTNDLMVRKFKRQKDLGGAVLLGVMGGRNSEGEDFPGSEMNSVVIVGVPFAKPTASVKASIRFYEENFPGRGRDYGYKIPAMRRAAQAAGRTIRKIGDRGAIIFLDWRFKKKENIMFLPLWLRENTQIIEDKRGVLKEKIHRFFYGE
ncbi:MAG: helicase C-terminal domain-containing protein [Candidatus Odinarchaeia archaeon]